MGFSLCGASRDSLWHPPELYPTTVRTTTMSWTPLLEGGLKDRAMESIATVLDALSTRERDLDGSPSLAGGTAGLAILHGYLAQTEGGQDHAALAARLLQRATAAVADHPGFASLYGGLAGVGWALAHLQDRLPGLGGENELTEIDQALLEHLDQSPWPDTYDLIDGLVGFGVYALERGPGAEAVACLELVIDRLAETAEHRPDGITWVSREEWLPPNTAISILIAITTSAWPTACPAWSPSWACPAPPAWLWPRPIRC